MPKLPFILHAALLAALASPLLGATFVVDSTDDQPDSNTSDNICSAAVTGACTLRAAIMQANATAGADTINLPAGTYQITRVGADDTGFAGDLDVTTALTIRGAGADTTIIDANGQVTSDRVFHIQNMGATVDFSGLTIRNGKPTAGASAADGGGIHAKVFRLFLTDVRVENNSAARGGGLFCENCELFIDRLDVRQNTAITGAGGGIYAKTTIFFARNLILETNIAAGPGGGLWADDVQVEIRDSKIASNIAQAGGGLSLTNAYLTKIERTEIAWNTAFNGGGLVSGTSTPTTLTDCSVHDNHADGSGGAIHNVGALALVRTTLEANSAAANGGGIMVPGLNLPQNAIEVRVENSTLSGNTAQFGGALYYQEIDDPQARHSAVLRNSTVAFNEATRDGGGIYTKGIARLFSSSSTIASNVLRVASASDVARGGGVFSTDTSFVSVENSIVADNYLTDGASLTTPDDVYTAATTSLRSNGFNLIETTTNYTLMGTTTGCIFGQDAKLDPAGLANNGGGIKTIALLADSPAINAGSSGLAPSTDGRGFGRSGAPDIGAYERDGVVPPVSLVSGTSRKSHGSAGIFDIDLALSGTPTVESRSGGANGNHTVVFTFAQEVASVGSATVSAGTGSVSSSGVAANPRQFIVNLTGATNAQNITITLTDVSDAFGYFSPSVSARMGLLLGDTTNDRVVNSGDATQTRSRSGQATSGTNFRSDYNLDGFINSGDATVVRSRSGSSIP